jgi:Raf kinase inhibitor-like YbhB/YbcL family protein
VPARTAAFSATSPAFADGSPIPAEYAMPAAGGRNVSIPVHWNDPPARVQSFAIEVVDLNPVANSWVHWLAADIPPGERGVAAGASGAAMPQGSVELTNSFGTRGWGGPQPPKGTGRHDYRVTVLALDVPHLDVPVAVSLTQFQAVSASHVLSSASFIGTFER